MWARRQHHLGDKPGKDDQPSPALRPTPQAVRDDVKLGLGVDCASCPPSPLLHEDKLPGLVTGGPEVCRLCQEGKLTLHHEAKLSGPGSGGPDVCRLCQEGKLTLQHEAKLSGLLPPPLHLPSVHPNRHNKRTSRPTPIPTVTWSQGEDPEERIENLLDLILKQRRERKTQRMKVQHVFDQMLMEELGDLHCQPAGRAQEVQDEFVQEPAPLHVDHGEGVQADEDPDSRPTDVRQVFLTRQQDLENLNAESENLQRECNKFNAGLTRRICSSKKDGVKIEEVDKEDNVAVFGNVDLSEDEMSLLRLGPGFMITTKLEEETMRTESTVTLTKMRWDRMRQGREDMTIGEMDGEDAEKTEEELNEEEKTSGELDRELRDLLSEDGKTLDMRKRRATDMKNNRKVTMPPPARPLVEAEYAMSAATWQKEFTNYKLKHCDDKDEQLESNLTCGQKNGLKSLLKKISKLECLVLQADKGKTFVVVDEATYIAMSQDHVANDVVVDQDEVKTSQAVLSSTGKSLANIMGLGKAHSYKNYIRCFDNSGSAAEDVPILRLMPKVHKVPSPAGHPQSRPVVAAATGLSSRAGDLLSDFLEPLITASLPRYEDLSTRRRSANWRRPRQ